MRLFELDFKHVPYKFVEETEKYFKAVFDIGEYTYTVYGERMRNRYTQQPYVGIDFTIKGPGIADSDEESFGMTNTGNQYQVLGTVSEICQEYFYQYPADQIQMSGARRSRIGVYTRMLKRIVPTWNVEVRHGNIVATKPE